MLDISLTASTSPFMPSLTTSHPSFRENHLNVIIERNNCEYSVMIIIRERLR